MQKTHAWISKWRPRVGRPAQEWTLIGNRILQATIYSRKIVLFDLKKVVERKVSSAGLSFSDPEDRRIIVNVENRTTAD
jgi:hypothetical protein